MSKRTWQNQFPNFNMPMIISNMIDSGRLEDISWGNDICPSVGIDNLQSAYDDEMPTVLFIDFTNIEDRELGDDNRYKLYSGLGLSDCILETNSLGRVLQWIEARRTYIKPKKKEVIKIALSHSHCTYTFIDDATCPKTDRRILHTRTSRTEAVLDDDTVVYDVCDCDERDLSNIFFENELPDIGLVDTIEKLRNFLAGDPTSRLVSFPAYLDIDKVMFYNPTK